MFRSSTVLLALLALTITVSAVPSSPLKLATAHGAFCQICKDLVKDGKLAGDYEVDVWLDKEIGTRCSYFGALESECVQQLKVLEHDIWVAIDEDIPEDKACADMTLC